MLDHKALCSILADEDVTITGRVNEIEYTVINNQNATCIFIPGTEADPIDIIRDMRIAPWYDKRTGFAHAGFLRGAASLMDEGITSHINPEYPIIVCGHSMGGAVSLLLTMMLQHAGYEIAEWVGFGTPRAFIGKRKIPFKFTSYRNGGDPVPNVPRWWMGGYWEVPLTQIGNDNGINVSDHHLVNYLGAL